MSVIARIEPRIIPTYPVGEPEKNPMFFERRVYQGSSGKVYPVPFIDKVHDESVPVSYQAATLENDFVRLVMLPEIGGRILIGQDKTNNDYDFFYRQDVIKPALVGLAGPWVSGGVEFNWPQHHRPGTFMPTDVHIEDEGDGVFTIWMSEHDPLNRLKGMHGIRLRPGSSRVELRGRLYNRTPHTHTFLWWANVAAEVHDRYQSFFPPDVHYVADHAVRAMSSFPIARNPYYGIDYRERPGADDLSWYANIPVPTSYMVCQTRFDFFGGYDFARNGGFVHVADRHIAPGKKQWTWGNDRFGWAWDRELTDEGGPYVELMAGIYTDNQPDFTYLLPYETKTFTQSWWPIQNIGPVQQANNEAALALDIREDRSIAIGLCVSEPFDGQLRLSTPSGLIGTLPVKLVPGESLADSGLSFPGENPAELLVELLDSEGRVALAYRPVDTSELSRERDVATEPPLPDDAKTNEELYLIGEHLEQYRHPTREPEPYWLEAIERDPGDCRARTALGRRALLRGEFENARAHLTEAVGRLTSRHPNPVTGEAHYHLGLAWRYLGDSEAALRCLHKAAWNYEWRSSAHYQIATIECSRHCWNSALEQLDASLATNRDHNKAKVLMSLVLHRLERSEEATRTLEPLLASDPLDHWARVVRGLVEGKGIRIPDACRNDAQTVLDLAFDFEEAGFFAEAIELIEAHHAAETTPVAVPNPLERTTMTAYVLAWFKHRTTSTDADATLTAARESSPDHLFPSRIEEMKVLEWAISRPGPDPVAAYGLGNLLYDKRRHADAIRAWSSAADAGSRNPQVHRNLGIAIWNHQGDGEKAAAHYKTARELAPDDPRLVSESDQLARKRNRPPEERLRFLEAHSELVLRRDDATVELAALLNLSDQPAKALQLLLSRRFHPWEGGEGSVVRQYTTARLKLGQAALDKGDAEAAHREFGLAMETPESLGEAYHPLQAKADVNYWLGRSLTMLGRQDEATAAFEASASERGDFTEMAVAEHSPLSYYRGLSLIELGRENEAVGLFEDMRQFARTMLSEPAKIDYFATSLPNLLVFDEDLRSRRDADAWLLIALASHGLRAFDEAESAVEKVLAFDAAEPGAAALKTTLTQTSVP
ncbi:tetratricopeptide repeat-containing protein [Haloferula helveola]|uniref:Tetratricopeptide repeat-containing protein n=1 Tax=Haloferula helveola TaxID=490095 RepID=A0ABM7RNY5_9BACT|nr:tetratricopeptide repeat-containing protein [Haloferula helveola]